MTINGKPVSEWFLRMAKKMLAEHKRKQDNCKHNPSQMTWEGDIYCVKCGKSL